MNDQGGYLKSTTLVKLYKDHWFDEACVDLGRGFVLHITTIERWKESELSGDEWRFSYLAQLLYGLAEIGSIGYGRNPSECLAASTRLFEKLPPPTMLNGDEDVAFEFCYKGKTVATATVPSAWAALCQMSTIADRIAQSDNNDDGEYIWQKNARILKDKCCQPGCSEPPVKFYKIVTEYNGVGERSVTQRDWLYRQFCERHSQRGDCGMDDADNNYVDMAGLVQHPPGSQDCAVDLDED